MPERVFTWVSEIPPHRAAEVQRFILRLDNDFSAGSALPLATLPMLHFASLTLCPQTGPRGPLLLFECSIDTPFKKFVGGFVENCRQGIDQIYQACQGYPAANDANKQVERFFSSRRVRRRAPLFHLGHPNRSVQCVRGDFELRRSIAHALEMDGRLRELPPEELIRTLRRRTKAPPWRRFWASLRPDHPNWTQPPSHKGETTRVDDEPAKLEDITWKGQFWSWARLGRGIALLLLAWALGVAVIFLTQWVFFREAIVAIEFIVFFSIVHYTSSGARVARGFLIALGLSLAVYIPFLTLPSLTLWFLTIPSLTIPFFHDPAWFWWRIASTLPLLVPGIFLFVAYLRIQFVLKTTKRMPEVDGKTFLEAEDDPQHSVYNNVVGLSTLKSDYRVVRLIRTWMVLFLLNFFYRTEFVKGQLVSVPTIHFAHWTIINKEYLLFVVHYDGGADRYLDDFFESLAHGVAFIWFDTEKYPAAPIRAG